MAERLADARIQGFLATKKVVVLATVQADGSPLAMPVWFLHDPHTLTMISMADTQKVRNIRRDPRVCVVAETGTMKDVRGIILQGRADVLAASPEMDALTRAFLERYHPALERLWGGRVMPPDRVMFRVVPRRLRSWGLAGAVGA